MDLVQAVVVGIVQGLTEFLPVSSSGHLILVPAIFGWEKQPLFFDVVLHMGTASALILFFWKELTSVFFALIKDVLNRGIFLKKYSREGKLGLFILAGTIPADIAGLFFGDYIENTFRSVYFVIVFLIAGSLLMFAAEKYFSGNLEKNGESKIDLRKSVLIGIFQSLALLPGTSRSGSTISGGMFLELNREEAAKFSFLLSVPVVIQAFILELAKSYDTISVSTLPPLFTGFLFSFASGLTAIKFLLNYLKNNSLNAFIIYRLVLAGVLLIFLATSSRI